MDANNKKVVGVSILLLTISFFTLVQPSAITSDWPTFHYDTTHTGSTPDTAPVTNELLWRFQANDKIYSSPAVVDNMVYIASDDGSVYCVDIETGTQLWTQNIPGTIWFTSPAVDSNYLYIGGNGLFCLSLETGAVLWSFTTGGRMTSSPVVSNDRVYIGSWDRNLYCFDATPDDNTDGIIDSSDTDEGILNPYQQYDLIWTFTTGNLIHSTPAVYQDYVFFGSMDKHIYCLHLENGTKKWEYLSTSGFFTSPVIINDLLYIGSENNFFYCLYTSDGTVKWSKNIQHSIKTTAAITNNKVFFGTGFTDRKIYCLDANTGSTLWKTSFEIGHGITSSPALAFDFLYFGCLDNKIYCIDQNTGEKIWEYRTNAPIDFSSPAVSNGKLFIGSTDSYLYCFQDPEQHPPNIPEKPTGETTGYVQTVYTYSTKASDIDQDQLYYLFDWGDDITTTWQGPYSSDTLVQQTHHWENPGTYTVKVKAKDSYYQISAWSESLTVTITDLPVNQLQLTTPTSAISGESFICTVHLQELPVKQVLIQIQDVSYTTNEQGEATLIAPDVFSETILTLTASKSGYLSTETKITIIPRDQKGWIYGVISNPSGTPVKDATLCITNNDLSMNDCSLVSSSDGLYYTQLPIGQYTLKASKFGYEPYTADFEIFEQQASEFNIILTPLTSKPFEAETEAIDHLITTEIANGKIQSKIEVDTIVTTQQYDAALEISDVTFTIDDQLSFIISSEELPEGIIAIRLTKDAFTSSELLVSLDDIPSTQVGFSTLLRTDEPVSEAQYTLLSAPDGTNYVVLRVPLSTHTVTISTLRDILINPIAVLIYLFLCSVFFALFFSPYFTNIIRRRRVLRKNK